LHRAAIEEPSMPRKQRFKPSRRPKPAIIPTPEEVENLELPASNAGERSLEEHRELQRELEPEINK
jgi:hypothetical protein